MGRRRRRRKKRGREKKKKDNEKERSRTRRRSRRRSMEKNGRWIRRKRVGEEGLLELEAECKREGEGE